EPDEHLQIGAARRHVAPAATASSERAAHAHPAEQVAEDVAEVTEDVLDAREALLPATGEACVTVTIVDAALLVVREDRIGLGDLFEARLRRRIVRVAVGVALER